MDKEPKQPTETKLVTITRKMQLLFNTADKDELKQYYDTLYRWQKIVFKAANMIATHHFAQEGIKDMFYLREDIRLKLADSEKDELGILSTSKMNSTYQVLSKAFKGDIPTAILTALNSTIVRTYNKERTEYFQGKRSLRTYKWTIPIPIRADNVINMRTEKQTYEGKEYDTEAFTLYGLPFKIRFGKDLSNNKAMWKRWRAGEYKLCDSSIQLKDNKIFLLAVFQFEKEKYRVSQDVRMDCFLDIETPIVAKIATKEIRIGNKEEFLHRRISIQESLRRLQRQLKYTSGGHGRQKKLQALERFEKAEKDYIASKLHLYSAMLIKTALDHEAGVLILKDQTQKEQAAKEENGPLLRNWSYYQLKEKIAYKASRVGIMVEVE